MTVAGWCCASERINELIHKLQQYSDKKQQQQQQQQQQKQLEDQMKMKMEIKYSDTLIHMVQEQSTIIDKGVSFLNCTNYEAVLT